MPFTATIELFHRHHAQVTHAKTMQLVSQITKKTNTTVLALRDIRILIAWQVNEMAVIIMLNDDL